MLQSDRRYQDIVNELKLNYWEEFLSIITAEYPNLKLLKYKGNIKSLAYFISGR